MILPWLKNKPSYVWIRNDVQIEYILERNFWGNYKVVYKKFPAWNEWEREIPGSSAPLSLETMIKIYAPIEREDWTERDVLAEML